MRLSRFYSERQNLREGSSIKLENADVNHIKKVLRLKAGDKIAIFNGSKEFLAELTVVSSEAVMAKILQVTKETSEADLPKITLFQSLLRAGKFDFIIEKATELGVDFIVPMESEYSQTKIDVAEKKLSRFNKIAVTASQQSERIAVAEVLQPIKFDQLKDLKSEFDLVIMFTIPRDRKGFTEDIMSLSHESFPEIKSYKNIGLLIGPEGGFSPAEHQFAFENGFKLAKFGNTVLRSETASIAILAVMNFIIGK